MKKKFPHPLRTGAPLVTAAVFQNLSEEFLNGKVSHPGLTSFRSPGNPASRESLVQAKVPTSNPLTDGFRQVSRQVQFPLLTADQMSQAA